MNVQPISVGAAPASFSARRILIRLDKGDGAKSIRLGMPGHYKTLRPVVKLGLLFRIISGTVLSAAMERPEGESRR